MRIAFISFEYPPDSSAGGIATYVAQAALTMTRRGHSVEVFAASPTRNASLTNQGIVENWICETNRSHFHRSVLDAFSTRHRFAPFDVVEGPEYFADAESVAQAFPDIPLVLKMHTPSVMIGMMNFNPGIKQRKRWAVWQSLFIGHAFEPRGTQWLRRFLRQREDRSSPIVRLEREHASRAAIVAPPCVDLCTVARKYWDISADRVRLAPHPYVPSKPFLEVPVTRTDTNVVGFVGRLERRKGIEVLAAAIPTIVQANPRVRFRFVGTVLNHASGIPYDKWLLRRLPQYADRLAFPGKVPLDRMHEVYAAIDVCVFPSLWENFPNVCLEAMAAGRAVVASMGGGMREMIVDRESGLLVQAGNAESLARGVISLLESPNDRQQFGMNARQRVLAAYNADVIGAMMEAVYRDAIRLHQPAAPTGR